MTQYNWSSREEWAQRVRTVYGDMTDGMQFGPSAVSSYASPEKIEQAIFELKCQWTRCGNEMKQAKKKAGPLARQPGEAAMAHYQRYRMMTDAEQDLAYQPNRLQRERKVINKVIRGLRDDELVSEARYSPYDSITASVAPIVERYDVLWKQDHDKYVEVIANTPIDDAAWEKELERRREIENPEIERVEL